MIKYLPSGKVDLTDIDKGYSLDSHGTLPLSEFYRLGEVIQELADALNAANFKLGCVRVANVALQSKATVFFKHSDLSHL